MQADINWIKSQLDKVQDADLVNTLKQLLTKANNKRVNEDFANVLSEEQRKSILKGIQQVELGETKPHSEAQKVYSKWL